MGIIECMFALIAVGFTTFLCYLCVWGFIVLHTNPWVEKQVVNVNVSMTNNGPSATACNFTDPDNVICMNKYHAVELWCVTPKEKRCMETINSFLSENDETAKEYVLQYHPIGRTETWWFHQDKVSRGDRPTWNPNYFVVALFFSLIFPIVAWLWFISVLLFWGTCREWKAETPRRSQSITPRPPPLRTVTHLPQLHGIPMTSMA